MGPGGVRFDVYDRTVIAADLFDQSAKAGFAPLVGLFLCSVYLGAQPSFCPLAASPAVAC